MTLSRPHKNRLFSPKQPSTSKTKGVHFTTPEVQPSVPRPTPKQTQAISRPPRKEPEPKTWLQQYWEDFKITNWWAVFVFTELFKGSEPSTTNENSRQN